MDLHIWCSKGLLSATRMRTGNEEILVAVDLAIQMFTHFRQDTKVCEYM